MNLEQHDEIRENIEDAVKKLKIAFSIIEDCELYFSRIPKREINKALDSVIIKLNKEYRKLTAGYSENERI
jgi:hypothetical protein